MRKNKLSVTLTILCILSLWHCSSPKTFPEELVGIWRTKSPDYEGSFLELNTNTISIGTVKGDVHNFRIIKIKKKIEDGGWESFIIHYLDNNSQKCELALYFHPLNDGILRLQTKQEITWFREKT